MNQQKEQLATRIVSPLGRRLRVYAALRGLAITDVVSAALDGYLPPLTDMVRSPEGGTVVLTSAAFDGYQPPLAEMVAAAVGEQGGACEQRRELSVVRP
jgi:hypothetical protein